MIESTIAHTSNPDDWVGSLGARRWPGLVFGLIDVVHVSLFEGSSLAGDTTKTQLDRYKNGEMV